MSENKAVWAPQDVLWELGASFIDAGADNADAAVHTGIEQIARLIEAGAAGLWRYSRRTGEADRIVHWAASAAEEFGPNHVVPDQSVTEELARGDGLAIVPLESIVGSDLVRSLGRDGRVCAVSVVDEQDEEMTVLVLSAGSPGWDTAQLSVIRTFTLILRQFHRRMRAERELEYGLRLEDFLVRFAERLMTVGPDDVDEAVSAALHQVHEIVDAQTIVLIDVIDDHTAELPFMTASRRLPEGFDRLLVEDVSALPGAGDMTLREYVSERRVLEVAQIVDALIGEEFTDEFGLRDQKRSVAILPASTVDATQAVIAVVRPADQNWEAVEFDALATVGSLVAQTRARVGAEKEAASRLELQRTLSATGKAFLEADESTATSVINDAIARLGAAIGADLAVVTSFSADGDSVIVEHSWSPGRGLDVAVGTAIEREGLVDDLTTDSATVSVNRATDELDPALAASPDGKWTTVVAPIRGAGPTRAALTFVFIGAEAADHPTHQEMANSMADLLGQFRVRLRVEQEIARRLEVDGALSAIADEFLGASAADAEEVVGRALERFAGAMGIVALSVRTLEGEVSASVGEVDGLSPGLETLSVPVFTGSQLNASLEITRRSGECADELDAYRSFATMLGQLRARVRAERQGEWRIARQRLLGECASDLAEAGPDDLRSVVESVLHRVCVFMELAAVSIWRSDTLHERYERRAVATCDFEADPHSEYAWGTASMLDGVRITRAEVRIDEETTSPRPRRIAFPRGEGDRIDSVLVATGRDSGPWDDEDLELLRSLSRTIREVESRVAAERYADAAFQGAPISVVLRDRELNLITCNQAFVDFVGADSIEELIGTAPSHVYDSSFEDVPWSDEDGRLTAEAAFRGKGGSRVWGQMRASVVGGQGSEDFWLIHIEDVTERRRAEQLLRFQASHDELTGLANRRQLLAEVHRLADGPGSAAVLLLDLDRFKIINDSLGHDRGDELLVVVADRLRLAVRPGDLVARLGGDEFAVLLPGPVTVAEATFVADRLLNLIGEPMSLGRQKIYPTASIGVAVIDDDMAVDDLLRRADTAMYRAKAQGRAQHAAFDEDLRDEVTNRMATEAGLRGALRAGELLVHYQPEVSLHDGRMLGAEALVRWQHPDKGLLAAGVFIDVAEETGLVVEIGEIVLLEACAEAARWPGGDAAPLVRVNLAAAQLQREDTVDLVRSVLAETGLAPHRLCLEITESAVMSDIHRSEEILRRLKALGIRLAVDDFGTGFSSLAYLKRFPVDALKIDRAFVRDLGETPEDTAFVRSIISLADALELEVVAEGVETEAQARALVELGCHRAQGFLYAKPGPAAELVHYLPPVAR